jgi:hypothetical protein
MTTDTPEAVRALVKSVKDSLRMGYGLKPPIMTALTRYAESLERTCEWRHYPMGEDNIFYSECAKEHSYEAPLGILHYEFCPYCGARIVEVRE